MKYRFKEIVNISKLQKLTDELFAASSIPSSIIDMDGEIVTCAGWQKICTDFHRKHPEAEKECIESNTKIRKKLKKGKPFRIYKCPRGLVHASTPIIIEGEHVANVFSGQVFLSPPDRALENFFRKQARKYGFDEAEYMDAFREIPVFQEEKLRSGISFLTSLAEVIADLGFSRMRELETLTALKESEERFRSIAEMNGECIWQLDLDGKCTFVSSTVEKLFGYTRKETIGMNYRSFFPEQQMDRAVDVFSKAVSGKPHQLFEVDSKRKDGSVFPIEVSISPVFKKGAVTGVQGIVRDVTQHKESEKKLKEDRDLIERIMETSPAGIVRVDADGRLIYSNRRADEILGVQLTHTQGRVYSDPAWEIMDFDGNLFPEEELPFSVVKRTGRPVVDVRNAVKWPDGRKVFLSVNAAPLFDDRGEFEGIVASLEDITQKIETEQNYRTLFQKMIDGFALHEIICNDLGQPVDYCFLAVNPAFERLTRLKGEAIIGKTILEVLPNVEDYWIERYGRVALTGEPVDFENYSRELDRYYHVTAFRPAEKQFACIFEDVTRNKMAENALKESEARFRSFMDNFPDPAFIKDKQLRYIYGNRAVLDIWQTNPEKFAGTAAKEYFNEEDAERIDRRDRIVLNENRVIDEEIMLENRFGEKEWRREIRFPIEMPNNEWLIGGISIDINEQIHGKEERNRLIAAIEQTGESLVITSRNGMIEYVNPAFEKITGYSRQEIVGMNPRILKSGYHKASVYKILWDTIRSGKRWTGRLINRRKDGVCYTSECEITPVKNSHGDILNFIWISRDVTGEIALEKRMAQAQKMESIGNLASGIAHDFNNILFPILGLAEMLLEDLPPGSPEHENAEEIHKAGKRGGDLVKQILSFGRKGEQKKLPIRIQQVLREVLQLTRATIPANIEMYQDIEKDCGRVLADPTQLHQIAMNLITNALHAVEETGGKISVGLKETVNVSNELLTFSIPPGKYARLTVSDTGCGMAPEVMEKIFEPYFTTKGQGKGTGLGLAVVYGIVREHHGEIRVRSEAGKGTTFDIYLPLVAETVDPSPVGDETYIPVGSERVLLVDDEMPIVRLVRQMLERLGYRVTAYTHSVDALDAFRKNPDEYDLVITDMTMPVMTGEQLVEEMLRIDPDVPIIICTGFSERINKEKAEAIGAKGLLMKPISKSDIGKMVRSVLDSAKSD